MLCTPGDNGTEILVLETLPQGKEDRKGAGGRAQEEEQAASTVSDDEKSGSFGHGPASHHTENRLPFDF